MIKDVVVVIVQNSKKEIYLHQRKEDKMYFPLMYGIGVGGKIEPGEKPIEAGKRELDEELGIESKLKHLFSFQFEHTVGKYTVQVLHTIYDGALNPCKDEFRWSGFVPVELVDLIYENSKLCPDTMILYKKFKEEYQ